ncbi:MAG TPA: histidine kinase dimerization/phospho-acceptor domain-containing protein, partial [Alphaproteobacteria bacterium]|nr:histidine kinase dimerization/phospho-acceptor domain-containing protein [Alphaproteobacteria bacterium]
MIKPVKRLLPKSLFGRTLLILITPLLVVQLVLGYIFFDRHTEKIVTTAASAVAGEVQSLWLLKKKGIPLDDLRVYATSMNLTLESLETSKSLELTKPALKSTTYEKSWVEFTLYEQLEQKLTSDFLFHFDDNSVGITLLENDQPYLKLSLSRKRLFSRTTPLVLIWTSISGVLLLGIASLFMKNQIKPIQKLAKAAQALGQGYLVEGFKPEGAYEVKKAGFAFLTMAERLKRHLNERLEVLAGISHDLRTPLTRLKLQMALIDHPAVEDMKKDVQEMQSMMESFLDFARGVQQEERTNLILQETLAKLLSYRTFQSVHVKCDPLLGFSLKKITFERCLDNLLSNAQK